MFSKELESLIQATLEDGKLEDYEKAVLVKRAQAEGVDLAELEIYINSILQRREHEANQKKEEKERKLYDEWTLYNELNSVTLTAAEKKLLRQ